MLLLREIFYCYISSLQNLSIKKMSCEEIGMSHCHWIDLQLIYPTIQVENIYQYQVHSMEIKLKVLHRHVFFSARSISRQFLKYLCKQIFSNISHHVLTGTCFLYVQHIVCNITSTFQLLQFQCLHQSSFHNNFSNNQVEASTANVRTVNLRNYPSGNQIDISSIHYAATIAICMNIGIHHNVTHHIQYQH